MILLNLSFLLKVTESEKYFFLNLSFLLKVGQMKVCQNPSFISTTFFQPNSAQKHDFRFKMISPLFPLNSPQNTPQGNEFPIPQKSRITRPLPPPAKPTMPNGQSANSILSHNSFIIFRTQSDFPHLLCKNFMQM